MVYAFRVRLDWRDVTFKTAQHVYEEKHQIRQPDAMPMHQIKCQFMALGLGLHAEVSLPMSFNPSGLSRDRFTIQNSLPNSLMVPHRDS